MIRRVETILSLTAKSKGRLVGWRDVELVEFFCFLCVFLKYVFVFLHWRY